MLYKTKYLKQNNSLQMTLYSFIIRPFEHWIFYYLLMVLTNILIFIPGEAIDFLLKNTFTEAAGARKTFPKVAIIITDGKSQDPVDEYARRLRNIGVEVFLLGMSDFLCYQEYCVDYKEVY